MVQKLHLILAGVSFAIILIAGMVLTNNSSMLTNSIDTDFSLINSTEIPQDITMANNEFAVNFYKQISEDSNMFFSPTSIYVAFSLLYEGAQNNTAEQMQETFGFESDDFARHNSTAHLVSSINQKDQYATLDIANALWPANTFTPYDTYLDIAENIYYSSVKTLDFGGNPKGSADIINQWASDNTNEKITKVVTPESFDDSTAMVINNAIYFKGTWLTQFSEEYTREQEFIQNNTSSGMVDFMNMKSSPFKYIHSDGVQVLKMPYEGERLSMMVILPDTVDGIISLEESISAEQIKKWDENLIQQDVIVSMPKFEMKTHYDLNDYLKNMGMTDVFDVGKADLLGIGKSPAGNLYVFAALHDAYVKVNEEGTEAAAVTTIIISTVGESNIVIPVFKADHPFIFIIQDDSSGAILFMGKVYDP